MLTALRPGKPAGKARRVIVFIHGIFSSHATFAELIDSFEHDARFDSYDLYGYDYDWGEPILTSARRLRSILNRRVPEGAEITLVK
jgi:pimeloyl-ACP methyl ester carboxylesterase